MRYTTALFLVLAAFAATSTAHAQTPAPAVSASPATSNVPDATQKTLTGLYALSCNAVQDPTDKNLSAAFAMLAPGYVDIDVKGNSHPRDEIVAAERMQLKAIEADDCTNSFDSFTQPTPDTVVVVDTMHVSGSMQAPDGKHAIDATSKTSDTWKLVSGSWQETQSKALHALVKVDGNVVQDAGN